MSVGSTLLTIKKDKQTSQRTANENYDRSMWESISTD